MAQNLKFVYALIMIIVLSSFLAESISNLTYFKHYHYQLSYHEFMICKKNADCPRFMCIPPEKPKCVDLWCSSNNYKDAGFPTLIYNTLSFDKRTELQDSNF
ncbi:putative Late nodulin [Medicago truncatula]|uniref:Putative Late nodulin n=1 Tax=Medicago truncatula TaxID=3880 RepID=A0A396GPX8_MEDTR|nr:putative Late nodulin [Medicago truncatula]